MSATGRRISALGLVLAGCAHTPSQEPRYAALDTILDTEIKIFKATRVNE